MDREMIAYLDERFGQVESRIRETRVEIEALRGDIRLVAEGVSMGYYEGLQPLRLDVTSQIEDLRKTLHTSQSDLHRRISVLEDWKRSTASDPIALIRERFGIKPSS